MILTGSQIEKEVKQGRIVIEPISKENLQPNSYDFRLGSTIGWYDNELLDVRKENTFVTDTLSDSGTILRPGKIYLGHTLEVMGSDHFVPIIRARSSVARLGLFIHVTADLIDIGSINQFTLQLHPVQEVRVYPGMLIGQVTFWRVYGQVALYHGKYQGSRGPQPSKIFLDFE